MRVKWRQYAPTYCLEISRSVSWLVSWGWLISQRRWAVRYTCSHSSASFHFFRMIRLVKYGSQNALYSGELYSGSRKIISGYLSHSPCLTHSCSLSWWEKDSLHTRILRSERAGIDPVVVVEVQNLTSHPLLREQTLLEKGISALHCYITAAE